MHDLTVGPLATRRTSLPAMFRHHVADCRLSHGGCRQGGDNQGFPQRSPAIAVLPEGSGQWRASPNLMPNSTSRRTIISFLGNGVKSTAATAYSALKGNGATRLGVRFPTNLPIGWNATEMWMYRAGPWGGLHPVSHFFHHRSKWEHDGEKISGIKPRPRTCAKRTGPTGPHERKSHTLVDGRHWTCGRFGWRDSADESPIASLRES